MRLHVDDKKILPRHVFDATDKAGASGHSVTWHRSTVRAAGVEVVLSGDGTRWANDGRYGRADYKAASWDQWGIVLAALYELDSNMLVGSPKRPIYRDAAHFHAVTLHRYDPGTGITSVNDERYHANHSWRLRVAHPEHGHIIPACKCGAELDQGA